MTRSVIVFLALALACNVAVAGVFTPIPYLPQEVVKPLIGKDRPADGTADMDDPAKLAERITENTKTAGDRLKEEDTSETTRQTQEQILKDIAFATSFHRSSNHHRRKGRCICHDNVGN